ncbi:hypothetical protein ACKKBG_A08810 [Auxenochlorella protothecoides x Auxenochlorella symbiontica]
MAYIQRRLCTAEELEAMSVNRKHGVSPALENRMKRSAIDLIAHAGKALNMDHVAMGTAVVIFHRYYATHSFLLNDKFLIAMACLYLGGKLEDTPKSARDVITACCMRRYGPEVAGLSLRNHDFLTAARERLFLAERAVLYALRFDVAIEHPFGTMLAALRMPALTRVWQEWGQAHPGSVSFQQMCINLLNDSYKLPLCLMFPACHVALACIWTVMKVLRIPTRLSDDGVTPWWQEHGMQHEDLKEISCMLLERLYHADYGAGGTVGPASAACPTPTPPKQQRAVGVKRKAGETGGAEEYNDLFDELLA